MDKSTAKVILTQSISNLQQRRGSINTGDLEAEVINNACLTILKSHKEKIGQGRSIEEMFIGALDATQDFEQVVKDFTESAMELFPGHYKEREAIIADMGIRQNVAWEGMWDFLRDYFQKNHGIQIDDVETIPLIFYSTKHRRYEKEIMTSESDVERTINITLKSDKKEIIVSVEPSLSPKTGYLVSKMGNVLKYKGYDPDYLFTVNLDSFEEIETFILEMPNRNLKIVYFE